MQRIGKWVASSGRYEIAEWVDVCQDGSVEVLGYKVIGPEADDSLLPTFEGAMEALESLADSTEAGVRPN